MALQNDIPSVRKGDWTRLKITIDKLRYLALGAGSNPTYAGLTLSGLTASTLIGANASKALESVTVGTGLDYTRPNLTLSHLGIEALTDPGVDKILFWDDTASASKWLAVGNSITITTTTIDTIQDIRTTASPAFAGLTLTDAAVISSDSIVFQPNTDSTTFFQVLDADGGTPVLNIDTTNEKMGIRTATPSEALTVSGNLLVDTSAGDMLIEDDGVSSISFTTSGATTYKTTAYGIAFNPKTHMYFNFGDTVGGKDCFFYDGRNTNLIAIFKNSGNIGFGGEIAPETLTEWTHATPYLTLHNSTHEDTDGGRESRINFKGEQGVDPFEETTLARIEVSHDGSGADDKGKLVISINDGNDGDTPTQALEIGSDLLATFAGGGLFGDDVDISGELDVTGDSAFGPVSPTALTRLSISKHVTITSAGDVSNRKGIHASVQVGKTGLADYTGVVTGISTQVQLDDLNTQDWTNANAIRGFNADINTESSSTGTVVGMCGYSVSANVQDAARVTNFYGYKVGTIQSFGGKLGNAYGVHIADITAGDTLNYAIYTGAGLVHFGDDVDVDGNADVTGVYKVDSTQVVSNRGAAVADATDAADVITQLNALLARCRVHGLIAI